MSIQIQFPDRDKQPAPIDGATESDFMYGLREIQKSVRARTKRHKFFAHSKSTITPGELLMFDSIKQDISVRLAHGLYVRTGMLLGIADIIAIDRGHGMKTEPVDEGLCAIGTIVGCSVELLEDIDKVFGHERLKGRLVPSALIRLTDVALYSTSPTEDELIPEYIFPQEVQVPLCYDSSAPFPVLPDAVHVENTVELDEPADNYSALLSTTVFRLESLEFELTTTS